MPSLLLSVSPSSSADCSTFSGVSGQAQRQACATGRWQQHPREDCSVSCPWHLVRYMYMRAGGVSLPRRERLGACLFWCSVKTPSLAAFGPDGVLWGAENPPVHWSRGVKDPHLIPYRHWFLLCSCNPLPVLYISKIAGCCYRAVRLPIGRQAFPLSSYDALTPW